MVLLTPIPLLLLVLTCLVTQAQGTCLLPPFLQQRDAPWAASYGQHAQLVMYVKETYMTVSQQGGQGDVKYTRKCEQRAPDGKFLMRHIQEREQPRFLCMQFLIRSENIVQIKASLLSANRSLELCDERSMAMDRWPIVHMSQTPDLNIPCPLQGGYNLRLRHPNNSVLCADSTLLMRLESDCERGEGIVFDFRQPECVPAMLPSEVRQQAFCIAHWTQGEHTFVVVQHGTVHKQTWCLRLTGPLADVRYAYLLLDLVCDTGDVIQDTSNFYRLELLRRVYASICEDDIDTDVCQSMKHLCKTQFKRHCARTCGACGKERGGDCAFEETYRGLWVDSTRTRTRQLNVGAYSLHVQQLGSYDCLRFQGNKRHKAKRVLVRIDENGCYPRYACTEMEKVSSSVMRFRLGNRLQWPLPQTRDHKDHVCAKENFLSGRDRLHQSQFHVQKAPRLLVKASRVNRLSCNLPPQLHHGVAFREEGQRCSGCLMYQPTVQRDRFVIRPHNCSLTHHARTVTPHHVTSMEYSCVATFTLHNHSHAVITTSAAYNLLGQYLAWVFTPDGQIQVLKAGDLLQFRAGHLLKVDLLEAQFTVIKREAHHHCRPAITKPPSLSRPLLPTPSLPAGQHAHKTPDPDKKMGARSGHTREDGSSGSNGGGGRATRLPPFGVTFRVAGTRPDEDPRGADTQAVHGPELDSSVQGEEEEEEEKEEEDGEGVVGVGDQSGAFSGSGRTLRSSAGWGVIAMASLIALLSCWRL